MPINSIEPIFVTGGTGFLGAYIIRELVEKGYSVRATRRSNALPFFIPSPILEKVEWVDGDILDIAGLEECMAGTHAVIHAAAKISLVSKERKEMFKTNIEGTSNLVNLALSQNVKRFIYVSSVAALGNAEAGATLDEGKQWGKVILDSNYAISKYNAEMEVWRAIAEGLNAAIVNPSTIIGYGDWNLSSCEIFKHIYQEFPWYSNGIMGFVSVKDVARAVVVLMESEISGERFILSSENWSLRQILDTIADGFLKKHPSLKAGPFLAQVAWRLEKLKSVFTGKKPRITKEIARIAQRTTYIDNRKMLQYFPGFTFQPLQETIREACEAYLQSIPPNKGK